MILLTRQLSPAVRFAIIITAATCCVLTINLLLWWGLSGLSTLLSALLLGPVFLASLIAVGTLAGYLAFKELEPRGLEIERLETNLRCYEAELEERQRAARAHAAIARLMEAGVRHLADGTYSSRITVELPQPYRSFPSYFNTVASRLEGMTNRREESIHVSEMIDAKAHEIIEAADTLKRRAEKLAERVVTDLEAIEKGAEKHTAEALKLAQYTMGGVKIATNRNIEAATQLAEMGRLVAEQAGQLRAIVEEEIKPEMSDISEVEEEVVIEEEVILAENEEFTAETVASEDVETEEAVSDEATFIPATIEGSETKQLPAIAAA